MKALVLSPSESSVSVRNIPKPSPGPREILIKVYAVALNHVDALYAKSPIAAQDDRVIGSDFSGQVVQLGEGLDVVYDARAKIGTRVAGFVQGGKASNTIASCTQSQPNPYHLLPTHKSHAVTISSAAVAAQHLAQTPRSTSPRFLAFV